MTSATRSIDHYFGGTKIESRRIMPSVFNLYRGRLAIKYILFELVPTFIFSVSGFVFLLTMAHTFKLGEYIIVHRAQVSFIAELLVYMVIQTLPMVIPMGLLFALL